MTLLIINYTHFQKNKPQLPETPKPSHDWTKYFQALYHQPLVKQAVILHKRARLVSCWPMSSNVSTQKMIAPQSRMLLHQQGFYTPLVHSAYTRNTNEIKHLGTAQGSNNIFPAWMPSGAFLKHKPLLKIYHYDKWLICRQ